MPSAIIPSAHSYAALPLARQQLHQRCVHPGPLVLGTNPLNSPTPTTDRYGERLQQGMWVGVGSICKRNSSPCLILDVLMAIKMERPDLRLHGFGLKTTALAHGTIRALLETADSMAWSFAARRRGSGANDWRNAMEFKKAVGKPTLYQSHFIELAEGCPTGGRRGSL